MERRGKASAPVRAGGGAPAPVKESGLSLKIIEASDTRAIARLFARPGRGDRVFDAQVRSIVDRVRSEGDRAVLRFARKFDKTEPPLEVTAQEMQREAGRVAP